MSELPQSEAQFLMAAIGWIELGLPAEADAELDRLPAAVQDHPDVLDVRWQVCAAAGDWDRGLAVAEALVAKAPESDVGWIHRAYSLRRSSRGGLQQAWEALLPAHERFPQNAIIAYNLACYAAQFKRCDEAWAWWEKALAVTENRKALKAMALADDDLQPLWERIRKSH